MIIIKYYFTSDYHLRHSNIIRYCDRPFADVDEMNETIIEKHNSKVKPEDTVLFLGDFSFGSRQPFLDRLNGKYVFIRGNHDDKPIIESITINYGGFDIYMTHWPQNYNPNYDLNFIGHVHEKWRVREKNDTILINVGVDQWDFEPVSIGDIHRLLNEEGLHN